MLNSLLMNQLTKVGIDPSAPPPPDKWQQLLQAVSTIYTAYQTVETDLRQSQLLYEELYSSTWRQTQELGLLIQVREALVNNHDPNSVIATVVEATAKSFGYTLVSIYLLQNDTLYLQHQMGYDIEYPELHISKGIMGRVARTGRPVLAENCQDDPDFLAPTEGLASEVCVPIFKSGKVVGVLNVETKAPNRLTSHDLDLMISLSEHLGIAMERTELYAAIKESSQKYRMVVDNISEGIFQVDLDGKFTFLNNAWYDLCGYSVEESIGQHFAKFINPSEVEHLRALQRDVETDGHIRLQTSMLRADGSLVPIESHLQRIYDADHTFVGWGGTVINVSDRLQAEKQAREMRLLVHVQEVISTKLDLHEMLRAVVETTSETFGYELISIYLLVDDVLHLQSQIGYDTAILQIPISEGIAGRTIRTQKPILVENTSRESEFLAAEDGLTTEVCIPLTNHGEAIGILNIEARAGHELKEADLSLLITLGEQVSIAVERTQLYTALKETNQKYQMVVDHIHEVILQTDLAGNILFLNKAWERLTHYKIADCMGQSFANYAPPDQTHTLTLKGREILQIDHPYIRFQTALRHIDGTIIPVEMQLQRTYDINGKLIGIGGTVTDITERLQAQKREQELGLLVQVRAAVFGKLDLYETIRTIVEATAEAFHYDLVGVYLLDGETLHLQYQVGYEIMYDPVDISVGVSGRVARTGIPALVQNTREDPDFVHAMNAPTSEVCVPLLHNGTVTGIMNVESKSRMLTESDLNMMIALSEHVTLAVERAQLFTAVVESNQKYEMVVNNVHEVIFQLDTNFLITFLNNSWQQISGYTTAESIGKSYILFMHPDEQNEALDMSKLLLEAKDDIRFEVTLLKKDHTELPVEIHMKPLYNAAETIIGIAGTIIDISERIQAEKQAVDLMIKERTVDMLKGFLTGVSHDLRTPLSIMNTSLYLLRHKLGSEENRHLDALEANTAHMQRVVEDMLDMSKLDDEIAELTLIRLNLNGLVRDLMVTLQSIATTKHQNLIFQPTEGTLSIVADQSMLGKAIVNIVKNAIQYTPETGSIHIQTRLAPDSTVKIAIQDSGIGIDSETIPHIFERFYKANNARPTGQGGTGLGLSIAHKIVEMHGGNIEVQSQLGAGSTFTISLPTRH